eukprot:626884-Pleurochrysis_carterae.AAC.1
MRASLTARAHVRRDRLHAGPVRIQLSRLARTCGRACSELEYAISAQAKLRAHALFHSTRPVLHSTHVCVHAINLAQRAVAAPAQSLDARPPSSPSTCGSSDIVTFRC